jgi:CBS domain-containing protein
MSTEVECVLADGRDGHHARDAHATAGAIRLRDVMTRELARCGADEDADAVARRMEERRVRRLPVRDPDERLRAIASLGDLARDRGSPAPAGRGLRTTCPSSRPAVPRRAAR